MENKNYLIELIAFLFVVFLQFGIHSTFSKQKRAEKKAVYRRKLEKRFESIQDILIYNL